MGVADMKQPTKDTMREQLALAADEIIRLRARNDFLLKGWLACCDDIARRRIEDAQRKQASRPWRHRMLEWWRA
jgi:hypothetical protein